MSTKITLEYYGQSGSGPTVKAAKADAAKKLQEFVKNAERGPRFHRSRDCFAVIFPSPDGWTVSYLDIALPPTLHVHTGNTHYPTLDEADRAVRIGFAQNEWTSDGTDISPYLTTQEEHREFAAWTSWQRRYSAWRATGVNDHVAHQRASQELLP